MHITHVLIHFRLCRHCDSDIELEKHTIPKGADVYMPIFLVHKNPEYWPQPHMFNPLRWPHIDCACVPVYLVLYYALQIITTYTCSGFLYHGNGYAYIHIVPLAHIIRGFLFVTQGSVTIRANSPWEGPTCHSVQTITTVLEWSLLWQRLRWHSLQYCVTTHLSGHQTQR